MYGPEQRFLDAFLSHSRIAQTRSLLGMAFPCVVLSGWGGKKTFTRLESRRYLCLALLPIVCNACGRDGAATATAQSGSEIELPASARFGSGRFVTHMHRESRRRGV